MSGRISSPFLRSVLAQHGCLEVQTPEQRLQSLGYKGAGERLHCGNCLHAVFTARDLDAADPAAISCSIADTPVDRVGLCQAWKAVS